MLTYILIVIILVLVLKPLVIKRAKHGPLDRTQVAKKAANLAAQAVHKGFSAADKGAGYAQHFAKNVHADAAAIYHDLRTPKDVAFRHNPENGAQQLTVLIKGGVTLALTACHGVFACEVRGASGVHVMDRDKLQSFLEWCVEHRKLERHQLKAIADFVERCAG